ncbi:hypothetical protein B0H10DRAFT_3666 [Mycena sp. CBHHK59/15]|nr:hypothetical protein B0H10DRAFT_3666 [Mycena sp. CBHHK59/15]
MFRTRCPDYPPVCCSRTRTPRHPRQSSRAFVRPTSFGVDNCSRSTTRCAVSSCCRSCPPQLQDVAERGPQLSRCTLTWRSAVGLGCTGSASGAVRACSVLGNPSASSPAIHGPSSPFVLSLASGVSTRCARGAWARWYTRYISLLVMPHYTLTLAAPSGRSERRARGACTARTRTAPSDVPTPRYAGELMPVFCSFYCMRDDVTTHSESENPRSGLVNIDHSLRAHGSWGRIPRGWGEQGWGYTSCPPHACAPESEVRRRRCFPGSARRA